MSDLCPLADRTYPEGKEGKLPAEKGSVVLETVVSDQSILCGFVDIFG